jgi:hypothetical protein
MPPIPSRCAHSPPPLQDNIAEAYDSVMGEREREMDPVIGGLTPATWPELLRRIFLFGPPGAYLRPSVPRGFLTVVAKLTDCDYTALDVSERVRLLAGLIDAVIVTDGYGNAIQSTAAAVEDIGRGAARIEDDAERDLRERVKDIREVARAEEKAYEAPIKIYNERQKLRVLAKRRKTPTPPELWGLVPDPDPQQRALQVRPRSEARSERIGARRAGGNELMASARDTGVCG